MSDVSRAAENALLLERLRQGDSSALDETVRANLALVTAVAARFTGRGMELEDLVQTGAIGLIRAARSFDPARGCVFSTYAVPHIAGEIRRALRDDGAIKVGRELKRRAREAARAREKLEQRLGREPRVSEIAAELGVSAADASQALGAAAPVRSLSEPVDGGDGSLELGGIVADPDDPYERVCERRALVCALRGLDPFERKLIAMRYLRGMSQQATGAALGVNQVKISREEKKIFTKLRAAMG